MSSSSTAPLKDDQDAPHASTHMPDGDDIPYWEEDHDEDGDVDFDPVEAHFSPEASSSLSSEAEVFDLGVVDSNENDTCFYNKLIDEVQSSPDGESEHGEDDSVMEVSDFHIGFYKNDHVHENAASTQIDVNNVNDVRTSSDGNPFMDFDEEDAICKRTRARYSLASFTLDELETFLQESDDEGDLQNVDDEEEYQKFLAAVLVGGDDGSLVNQENENVDDEDNDADFEIEIDEALESDLDDKTEKEEYEKASRRPETRQTKRQKAIDSSQRKLIQQAKRPLRPFIPIMPNAPFVSFHGYDGRRLMLEAAPQCVSSSGGGGFINGFAPHQISQLHCLIYEHVQLLIQVFSMCVLDSSRDHITSQVQGLISETLHNRHQALTWRNIEYPAFWFHPPCYQPLVPIALPKIYPTEHISESSLTPDARGEPSSTGMISSHNNYPSKTRNDYVYNEQNAYSQTTKGFGWLPLIGGPLLSIMDVAPLRLVENYMDDVKIAAHRYRQRILEDSFDLRVDKEPLFPFPTIPSFVRPSTQVSRGANPSSMEPLSPEAPSEKPSTKKTLATKILESSKTQPIALVHKEIVKLCQRFFHVFNPELFPRKPPPAQVVNRVLFTDAEDELLAMGLMEFNSDWKAIQQRFLPCKSKHQIFVRQKNRSTSKAPENQIKAVKRMKNSPLTVEEQRRIQEGFTIFKHDWISIWRFMVPHRDPSLLPRQWRISIGTQKSYKMDGAKRKRRQLYEIKRRKMISDSQTGKAATLDYQNQAENMENSSGEDSIDNEDEAYVHEAFLADWRPDLSTLGVSELPSSSIRDQILPDGLLNSCESGEALPHNNILKEFSHDAIRSGHPYHLSNFTQARPSNIGKPNPLATDLKSTKAPIYMRPYRARRLKIAPFVKLSPQLPPVYLPSSARVISQSALKTYQHGPSEKVNNSSGGISGPGKINTISKLPNTLRPSNTRLTEVIRTKPNSLLHRENISRPEESELFKDKCIMGEKGTESDLQMHPLLFRALDDGHLPYYPLKCSVNSSSSFSFFSRNQHGVGLNLFHNPHQENPTVKCFNKPGKLNESNSTPVSADFHPLLQRIDNGNSDSLAVCSPAHLSVDVQPSRGEVTHLQNSFDANQSNSDPSALRTKSYSPTENGKANELDLEFHLSCMSRMEKAIGHKVMTEQNTIRTPDWGSRNKETTCCDMDAISRSKNVFEAPVLAEQNNYVSGCGIDNMCDLSLHEIVMEQEELSDSDEEVVGHVEFECEEMEDSETEDQSDCEEIAHIKKKEVPNYAAEGVLKVADGDDRQCEPIVQGDFQSGKVGAPLPLGMTSQDKDIERSSTWLSLNLCAPISNSHEKVKVVESTDGEGPAATKRDPCRPNRHCKETPIAKRVTTMSNRETDMTQHLSLGPPPFNPIKNPRKRATRSNFSLTPK